MVSLKNSSLQHALVTVYGDNDTFNIEKSISKHLKSRDIRVLNPNSIETLLDAAHNSSLVFVAVGDEDYMPVVRVLQADQPYAGQIVAVMAEKEWDYLTMIAAGFDHCIGRVDLERPEFKDYLTNKIIKGSHRLSGLLREEEFDRLNDALSMAPISMIIFDADKRAVFVSDHYFRTYPKIAPRLIRGLRVYDAFDIMITEEGIGPDDPRYEGIRQFWHTLQGHVEFTLDDGTHFKVKAIELPNHNGTLIIAQNITRFINMASKSE